MQTALAVERSRALAEQLEQRGHAAGRAIFAAFARMRVVGVELTGLVGSQAGLLPSPVKTFDGAIELIRSGELQADDRGELHTHHRRLCLWGP